MKLQERDDFTSSTAVQFRIKNLLVLTGLAALAFASLQLPKALAQTAVTTEALVVIHCGLARRIRCIESVFAGLTATVTIAFLTLFECRGRVFGRDWLELVSPLDALLWTLALTTGCYMQLRYASRLQRRRDAIESEFQRLAERCDKNRWKAEIQPRDGSQSFGPSTQNHSPW